MSTFAAVMTGKGIGAIATILLFGDTAKAVIKEIFKPAGTKPAEFITGKILLGTITQNGETIDQVTIGCEGRNTFAINCHGNPLIAADIMQLLQKHSAALLTPEELLAKIYTAQKGVNTIALEARLAHLKAKTIPGTKIIANQISAGLSKKANQWLRDIKTTSLDQITSEAEWILANSQTAKLIISGCTIVLAGPPNSGKSTLLNHLAGRQKAIVTDIEGTTRDWVSARCQIGPLSITLIDTAGLDEKLSAAPGQTIEKKSQQRSVQMSKNADLVLLVLDNSRPADQLDDRLPANIYDRKILTVLNKSDLPAEFDTGKLPENLGSAVQISAKFGAGIENLKDKILQTAGVVDFDLQSPVCFTPRQQNLIRQLSNAESTQHAASIITELLNAPLSV